ncbi:MAG TPA: ATP-binding protein [Gemmatimonadaceae bacterium]|nr:ATP-binding protein [Gemmatimonadaceae bacterium]
MSERTSAAELEERLQAAEARFAGIVSISADAVISIDEHQRIILFNEGAERIFGYTAEEAIGQPLEILLPVRFRSAHRAHVASFGQGMENARQMGHRREISGLRKNGEEFPAEASISRYRSGKGVVYSAVLRDITDRKRAEEGLRFLAEAGELLAGSLDYQVTIRRAVQLALPRLGDVCVVNVYSGGSMQVAELSHVEHEHEERISEVRRALTIDPSGSHPAAVALRSRTTVVLSGHPADGTLAGPVDAALATMWREVRAASAIFAPLLARDRALGVMSLFSCVRRYDQDDVLLAEDLARRIALALDNARLYDEAQRAIRARDETVAVVSHDLRNPVNAISMIAANLDTAALAEAEPAQVAEYLQVIRQAAAQADALIQDLLDVTRIEAGRLSIDAAEEDLAAVVGESVEVLAPLARDRALELEVELAADLPPVQIDAMRIQQVLSNLVGNAIKFTPAGGRIDVRAARAGDEVVVRIADTGPGIAPEQQPHIFDRYWQGNRPTRLGAGLGLPIAKGIVEAHGGRIWVQSTPDAGSVFAFSLPAGGSE